MAAQTQLEKDRELLDEIDGHPKDCNGYESERVERLLKQLSAGKIRVARPLMAHDRKWALDLLQQLDHQR